MTPLIQFIILVSRQLFQPDSIIRSWLLSAPCRGGQAELGGPGLVPPSHCPGRELPHPSPFPGVQQEYQLPPRLQRRLTQSPGGFAAVLNSPWNGSSLPGDPGGSSPSPDCALDVSVPGNSRAFPGEGMLELCQRWFYTSAHNT